MSFHVGIPVISDKRARGVRENLSALLPVLPHALEILRGQTEHGG